MNERSEDYTLIIEKYEKKIYDQKQLLEISKALNSTLEINYLIDSILNLCLVHLQTLDALLFISKAFNNDHFELESNFKGFDLTTDQKLFRIPKDSILVNYFNDNYNAVFLNQIISSQKEFCSSIDFLKKIGAEMIVPLNAKGRVNGILALGEKMSSSYYYTKDDKLFLSTLAGFAGIAVENAILYELATVDMMTGLKVHHYFQTRLKEEIEKCKKMNKSLTLIMTDIDDFKLINDTYGHQTGDIILKKVAHLLKEKLRKNDLAARYGGEEFCLILPNTSKWEAFEIAERVRKEVDSVSVLDINGKNELHVTLSLGITELTTQDTNNFDLIEKADKALYKSKRSGKNQTVFYDGKDFFSRLDLV